MWTPVSVGTPPDLKGPLKVERKTTEDLQEHMQTMIDLQVLQQQQYAAPPPITLKPPRAPDSGGKTAAAVVASSTSLSSSFSSPPNLTNQENRRTTVANTTSNGTTAIDTTTDTGTTSGIVNRDTATEIPINKTWRNPIYPTEDGVGRGTLLFASNFMRPLSHQQQQQHQQPQPPHFMGQSRNTSPTLGTPSPPPLSSSSSSSSPPPPLAVATPLDPSDNASYSGQTRDATNPRRSGFVGTLRDSYDDTLLPHPGVPPSPSNASPSKASRTSYGALGHSHALGKPTTTTLLSSSSSPPPLLTSIGKLLTPVERRVSSLSDDQNQTSDNDDDIHGNKYTNDDQQKPPPPTPALEQTMLLQQHIQMQQQQQQEIPSGLSSTDIEDAAHTHDFYYASPFQQDHDYRRSSRQGNGCCSAGRRGSGGGGGGCCCLWRPFVDAILWWTTSEDLHRSFILGAIDGLVTGSSLLAALLGLHVWQPDHLSHQVRMWLVAVSMAVAIAEALCMAVGHVRTTYTATVHTWQERQQVAVDVQTNRSAAKGHLVDLLLQRGLLKIDAMSIADTLEGYPDVCVSLLAGEGLADAAAPPTDLSSDNLAAILHHHVQPHWQQQQQQQDRYQNHPPQSQHRHQHYHTAMYEELDNDDPGQSQVVKHAVREAWIESLGMMIGFGVAATFPALIVWGLLPPPVTTHREYSYVTSSYHSVPDQGIPTSFMHPTTLLVLVLSLTMMVLGWFKAHVTAGAYAGTLLESVLLLWLGWATAYGVGLLLHNSTFWPECTLTVST